ncbi:MAG: T9SS type A sorting domain-containing protein [Bacteroidia bacterium]
MVKLLDNGSSFSQIYDVPTYGNNSLELNKMVFSAGDNAIYLAGTINSTTTYNWFVYKLNATTGAIEWSDSAFNSLGVSKLLVSPTGNVIVAGGGENYYLWFYNSTGNVDRVFVYDGACQANDMISDALLVGTGAIVVTGYACENSNTIAYGTTIKYNYPTITTGFPAVESLSGTLFPNPSGDRVFIIGTLQIRNVQAVDQFGKLINLPFEGNLINVGSLSNGIYVLTILSDEGAMSEKLLIEK